MSVKEICARCFKSIDKSDTSPFCIITDKGTNKQKRAYICESCTYELREWIFKGA